MNKLLEFLFISNINGVGKKTIHKKYIDAIWRCNDLSDLIETYLPMIESFSNAEIDQAKDSAQKQMEELLRTSEVSAITFFDDLYPASVKALEESAPLILYVKGDGNSLVGKNIAVVGTRKPSDHTTAVERNLVGKIIDLSGSTIVSGLAFGCDRIAHETTVNKKGRTIAVLPSGVENVVPLQHKELAEQIVAGGGCLVSEYRIHAPATKGTFVERDSLIAALSEVTVVAECSVKSGTMHTVDAAVKLKRKIACYMPTDLTKGSYEGNLHMVQNMGAIPLKDTEDLKRIL